MDKIIKNSDYTAVLLAAGYGSRISSMTNTPKCLLEIQGKTLLEWNLSTWIELGITKVNLVVGYKWELVKAVADKYQKYLNLNYVINEDYRNLGNTHSLYLGIKNVPGPVLIFDADLIYDSDMLKIFLEDKAPSSILIGQAELGDIECAKALVDELGNVRKTVDKRAVSEHELALYKFAGEAIGILKFSKEDSRNLCANAVSFLAQEQNKMLNWEHLLNQFLPKAGVKAHITSQTNWIEIDNAVDYQEALQIFGA